MLEEEWATEYHDIAELIESSPPKPKAFKSESIWALRSIAIPLNYICIGFIITFPNAFIEYYPRQLQASDAQLSTIHVLRNLPWTFKVLYGVLADVFPLRGYRFKPYMVLGYVIASLFNLLLASSQALTVVTFTLLLFGAMLGLIMTDVMADALLTSRAMNEPVSQRGQVQSAIYMIRFLTEMVGYWLGSILSNRDTWGWGLSMSQCFAILAILPLILAIPFIYCLDEPVVTHVQPFQEQLLTIWKMLQLRATWQPLAFLIFYNTLHTYNAAWGNYLQVAYQFNAFQYGSMAAVGSTVGFFGVYMYKRYFLVGGHWQFVYVFCSLVIALFSICNVLLVFHINDMMGISPYWFALGDTAVQKFAVGLQYLPSAVMFVRVCPEGQEAVAFALLTGFTNMSGGFTSTISNAMLGIWPVQLEDMQRGNMDGVWKLTLLTSLIHLIPVGFIPYFLPNSVEQLDAWKQSQYSSRRGGIAIVTVYIVGFVWVLITSLIAIVAPCNRLVGGHGKYVFMDCIGTEILEELPPQEVPRVIPMSFVYDAVEYKTLCGIVQLQYIVRRWLKKKNYFPTRSLPQLVICGPPAGGKGALCELLVKQYNVVHLYTGDILRAGLHTDVGMQAKVFIDAGELVPDQLIIELILNRLRQDDCIARGWLLDGFPRTKEQTLAMLGACIRPDLIVCLQVPDEEVIIRIAGRRIDPVTGKTYHIKYNPPPPDIQVIQKSDDNEATLRVRLTKYHEHSKSILSAFSVAKVPVITLNGLEMTSNDMVKAISYRVDNHQESQPAVAEIFPPCQLHPEVALEHQLLTGPVTLATLDAIMNASAAELQASRVKKMVNNAVATMQQLPRVILLGPPGIDLTPQHQLILSHLKLLHVTTSNTLQVAIETKNSLGLEAKSYVARNQPIPTDLTLDLMLERLAKRDCLKRGWLLEGFPNTLVDAQVIINHGYTPHLVVVVMVADDDFVALRVGANSSDDAIASVEEERARLELLAYNEYKDDMIEFFQDHSKVIMMDATTSLTALTSAIDALKPTKKAQESPPPLAPSKQSPKKSPKKPSMGDEELDAAIQKATIEFKAVMQENARLKRLFVDQKQTVPRPPPQFADKEMEILYQTLLSEKKSLLRVTKRQKGSIDANEWDAMLQKSFDELDQVKRKIQMFKKSTSSTAYNELNSKLQSLQLRYDQLCEQWKDLNDPDRDKRPSDTELIKLRKREQSLLKTDERYYQQKMAQIQLHTSQETQRISQGIEEAKLTIAIIDEKIRQCFEDCKALQSKLPKISPTILPQLKLPKTKPLKSDALDHLPPIDKPKTSDHKPHQRPHPVHQTSRT
ncbi:folate-Biopterin Transporter (FBT) family [Thraustotheca clavata]|uniref:Folate-Biopterin Transporter (FBT) family n=1 Tax=Thraustotheca clavata TaxID=74557 RepID=A0A1V9YZE5_9STRA|nr:folate-Biopterin Transporter (FBT) family [Thraustotheca clavata]